MNESKILELLAEYLRKTDRVLNRLDSHDEIFERQFKRLDMAYQVIIGHSEKIDHHKEEIEEFKRRTKAFELRTEAIERKNDLMELRIEAMARKADAVEKRTVVMEQESKKRMKALDRLSTRVSVVERRR